jgi:hypothetical protein
MASREAPLAIGPCLVNSTLLSRAVIVIMSSFSRGRGLKHHPASDKCLATMPGLRTCVTDQSRDMSDTSG